MSDISKYLGKKVIILPNGVYTTGTFTLPNNRVWDDFEEIQFIHGLDDVTLINIGNSNRITRDYFINTNPTNWSISNVQDTTPGVIATTIAYVSATQFSITRTSNDYVALGIGWLRNRVYP